jgi:phage-related protein
VNLKCLIWVGSSKRDLLEFPKEVKSSMGYGLYLAQAGERPLHSKILKGFGSAGVIEIFESDESGTFRVVYTIKISNFVFVLHAFQKKSKQGIKTPKQEVDLIKKRLKETQEIYKELNHEKEF